MKILSLSKLIDEVYSMFSDKLGLKLLSVRTQENYVILRYLFNNIVLVKRFSIEKCKELVSEIEHIRSYQNIESMTQVVVFNCKIEGLLLKRLQDYFTQNNEYKLIIENKHLKFIDVKNKEIYMLNFENLLYSVFEDLINKKEKFVVEENQFNDMVLDFIRGVFSE